MKLDGWDITIIVLCWCCVSVLFMHLIARLDFAGFDCDGSYFEIKRRRDIWRIALWPVPLLVLMLFTVLAPFIYLFLVGSKAIADVRAWYRDWPD